MIQGRPLSFDREEVLGKAMQLFWSRGYDALGMSDLLDEMGIQRQSFYNAFGSKEDVFLEAFQLYCGQMKEKVLAIFASAGSPLQGLHGMFDLYAEMVGNGDSCGCLVCNTMAEFGGEGSRISEAVESALVEKEQMLHGVFKAAIDAGEIPSDKDPRALAGAMVAFSQGLALMSKNPKKTKKDMLAVIEASRNMILS